MTTPDLRDARNDLVGKVTFLIDGPDTASLTLRGILTRYIDEAFAALASQPEPLDAHPGSPHDFRMTCLDVERLARALHAAEPVRYQDCYHGLTVSDCGIDAEDIAAEYARLSESDRTCAVEALAEAIG